MKALILKFILIAIGSYGIYIAFPHIINFFSLYSEISSADYYRDKCENAIDKNDTVCAGSIVLNFENLDICPKDHVIKDHNCLSYIEYNKNAEELKAKIHK